VAVLISADVPIDPQGNSWVAAPQLPLYDSHGCAVCEQSAGSAMTEAAKSAAWNAQPVEQPMQLLLAEFICREWASDRVLLIDSSRVALSPGATA